MKELLLILNIIAAIFLLITAIEKENKKRRTNEMKTMLDGMVEAKNTYYEKELKYAGQNLFAENLKKEDFTDEELDDLIKFCETSIANETK